MWLLLKVVVVVVAAASPGTMLFAELQVKPDKENVVASSIEGSWQMNADLTQKLEGTDRPPRSESPRGSISFAADESVAAKVPAKYEEFFADKAIYLAGIMTWAGKTHPFLLIEHKGNPCVVYFVEKDDDPMGDGESFYVMLAKAKERENDLLFIGGDFNNQPFAAYERVKE